MDKTAIKNFAIEARKILMKSAVTEAGFYGITESEIKEPTQKGNDFEVYETVAGTENRIYKNDIRRRANLVKAIQTQGFEQVIEETAYTWFNRIIAIRFMEVNNYLPTRVRVLSSEAGGSTPDIITQSDTVELGMNPEEIEQVRLAKQENRYDDAFRMLFIKQCNELHEILPGLFEKTDDYMELLLKIPYTGDGVIRMLVDTIPEDNFNVETEGQVEIIGWMYQYYNTELKDDTFAKLKKNIKITKERIPAATQLFTPDWIVRYMVENSLGRVWIEHLRAVDPSVDEKSKAEEFGWKYYLPEAEQEEEVQNQLVEIRKSYKDMTPQDITCIDPCMGSGHILVYMFDVLMDIYRSEGFSEREAVFDILEKNIRGLDIDRRAYQLSYFALMMKARGYNRIFFRGHEDMEGNRVQAVPRVYAIEESNSIIRNQIEYLGADLDEEKKEIAIKQMNGLLDALHDAKEYGSIINVERYDWDLLRKFVSDYSHKGQVSLFEMVDVQSQDLLGKLIDIGEVLSKKYYTVVTNPPYMGANGMSNVLVSFLKKEYSNSKSDMSTVFMERSKGMCLENGYMSMINIPVWMFLQSYEKMRETFLKESTYISLLHPGRGIFGSDFGTTSFVIRNSYIKSYFGRYYRLFKKQGDVENSNSREKAFLLRKGEIFACQDNYNRIPGIPVAYWASKEFLKTFEGIKVGDIEYPKQGLSSADNNRFLRIWQEINYCNFSCDCGSNEESKESGKRWFPFNKGGEYRKWYGNFDYVINWYDDGNELRNFKNSAIRNSSFYFLPHITWSKVSISSVAFRYRPKGSIFSDAGCSANFEDDIVWYALGLLNSNYTQKVFDLINPTVNYTQSTIASVPFIVKNKDKVTDLVKKNMMLSEEDWNSFENSWNYRRNPLAIVPYRNDNRADGLGSARVVDCFNQWKTECDERFSKLKEHEEELNRIFADIYGLQDELRPEVEDKDITVRKADLQRDIKSLVSYSVGCMFGRYSLDEEGLVYAGGEFDKTKYKTFPADADAIIPITDEAYFEDDIVGRFEEFIRVVYGEETLEENLEFIADALGTKGTTSREKIRNYFLNDFFKDHCATYSVTGSGKRPIYWLFDSGKHNGFKCLIYLHRYTQDTVGLIRSDYLTKTQSMIENALKNAEYAISTSTSAVDRAQATKKRDKYIKQLAEIRAYYPALSHIALQRIPLDLDDGVKVNYAKFQGIEVSVEGEKKQKVDLLAKI